MQVLVLQTCVDFHRLASLLGQILVRANVTMSCVIGICDGDFVLEDEKGIIESPGYPIQYPADLQCIWIIKLAKENKVSLRFV